MDDAGADDKAAAAGQAQALEGAQDNDGPASAAAPFGTSDNDLSSVAGVSSASPSSDLHLLIRGLESVQQSYESTAAKKGSASSSSGYKSLGARPKTRAQSKTYKRYWDEVKRAARENKPDVLRELMKEDQVYYKEEEGADEFGWTALHYAAFLGHTECVSILLNKQKCLMDIEAADGSTALMVACANLPTSKKCIKVLCEHKANKYKYTNEEEFTALCIAIERKRDLEVVRWLVSGADMRKLLFDSLNEEFIFEFIFISSDRLGDRLVKFPSEVVNDFVNDEEADGHFRGDETEVAQIALHLADHGCVKGALFGLLVTQLETPQLKEVVECLLENGAVMNELNVRELSKCKPRVLSLFAKKSVIYLESLERLSISYMQESPHFEPFFNALTITLLRGQASGILPLTTVKEIHDILKSEYGEHLPAKFLPLETLYGMTKNPPSLCQIARTKIRAVMAESGKFSRENFKKLSLPKSLIDLVQLGDLGDGKKIETIMKSFDIFDEDEEEDDDEEGEQDEE